MCGIVVFEEEIMKFEVQGTVQDIKTRWRCLLFPQRYALIKMDIADIERIQLELVRRFPLHPSLGSRGAAVPLSQVEDPEMLHIGARVLMTFVVGNQVDEFFLGSPALAMESLAPVP